MILACRSWGGLTLEQWDALSVEDQEVRLALVQAERQPLTPEALEKQRAEAIAARVQARHAQAARQKANRSRGPRGVRRA